MAQLDSASDSDSEGRRFESFRVGQKSTSFDRSLSIFTSSLLPLHFSLFSHEPCRYQNIFFIASSQSSTLRESNAKCLRFAYRPRYLRACEHPLSVEKGLNRHWLSPLKLFNKIIITELKRIELFVSSAGIHKLLVRSALGYSAVHYDCYLISVANG